MESYGGRSPRTLTGLTHFWCVLGEVWPGICGALRLNGDPWTGDGGRDRDQGRYSSPSLPPCLHGQGSLVARLYPDWDPYSVDTQERQLGRYWGTGSCLCIPCTVPWTGPGPEESSSPASLQLVPARVLPPSAQPRFDFERALHNSQVCSSRPLHLHPHHLQPVSQSFQRRPSPDQSFRYQHLRRHEIRRAADLVAPSSLRSDPRIL